MATVDLYLNISLYTFGGGTMHLAQGSGQMYGGGCIYGLHKQVEYVRFLEYNY